MSFNYRSILRTILSWQPRGKWQNTYRIIFISIGILFVSLSVYSISQMVKSLREKELYDVEMWVKTMKQASLDITSSDIANTLNLASAQQNIPFIVLDESMTVLMSHLIDEDVINHPDQLRRLLGHFADENRPIEFQNLWGNQHYYLLYGTSELLRRLSYIPYAQYGLFIIFFLVAFIALRSTKQGEQDRIWVGLAKETAHQLGTPISSLLGWVDYLRDQDVEPDAVSEMERDLAHLLKVTDRFSKIGADTPLQPANVNEVVESVVQYFRGRIPRGVTLVYDGLSMAPATADLNPTLFEWVIENLLKNALDALQGAGAITVSLVANEKYIIVDVRDTGRGISKSSWSRIFDPGFTTKSRGWGLGLSLSRRVIEDYHSGKIAVVASEIGVGTTIRITLKRVFDL